jgi:hypothetical protein
MRLTGHVARLHPNIDYFSYNCVQLCLAVTGFYVCRVSKMYTNRNEPLSSTQRNPQLLDDELFIIY